MNKDAIWIAMSYAWADTELSELDLKIEAEKISAKGLEIIYVILVCIFLIIPTFAVSSFFAIATAGMSMPDFGYNEQYVIEAHRKLWYRRYVFFNLVNPLFWIGLPISYIFGISFLLKLLKAIRRNAIT